jgi:hypothetical protein
MNHSDYFNGYEPKFDPKSVHWITRMLWWCAGADTYFLLRSPKQDRVKYAGIGGIVLATGVLAAVSGWVAFTTGFGPKLGEPSLYFRAGSVTFAILWGLMIFNLDRFIVSSTGKGDGTDKMTWPELRNAFPRILIAIVLGVVMSSPLEILVLKPEIDAKLDETAKVDRDRLDALTNQRFKKMIAQIDIDLQKIESDRKVLIDNQLNAEKEYIDQMQGRAGNAGYGPRAKQLELLKNEKIALVNSFDAKTKNQIENLKLRREEQINDQAIELAQNKRTAEGNDGLLARIKASHEIGGLVTYFLMALIFSIEMGPIFFKMMMNKGAYDYMVENFNLKQNIENGIIREEHLYEGKDGALLMEKYRYLQVEAIQKEKEDALAAQKELSGHIVGNWKTAQLKKLGDRPEDFYKSEKV